MTEAHTRAVRKWRASAKGQATERAYRERTKEVQRIRDEARRPIRVADHHARLAPYLSLGCSECPSHDHLVFHHVDPTTKKHNVSLMPACSTETFLAEVAKCVVLCAACHAQAHVRLRAQS